MIKDIIIYHLKEDYDKLKQQLAEKDKEIEAWKEAYYEKMTEARQQLKDQRHQVCEEIKIKGYYCRNGEEKYYKITPSMLWEIEKGE